MNVKNHVIKEHLLCSAVSLKCIRVNEVWRYSGAAPSLYLSDHCVSLFFFFHFLFFRRNGTFSAQKYAFGFKEKRNDGAFFSSGSEMGREGWRKAMPKKNPEKSAFREMQPVSIWIGPSFSAAKREKNEERGTYVYDSYR